MSKKKGNNQDGIVYSTNPDFPLQEQEEHTQTLHATQQKLKISLDKKQRAGKAVTLVSGFQGNQADAEALGKKLKTHCGTGGSVKDCDIIIQGDQREKVLQWLKDNGYTLAKRG